MFCSDIDVIIKSRKNIYEIGSNAELECDLTDDARAVSWYKGSRILGTTKLDRELLDEPDYDERNSLSQLGEFSFFDLGLKNEEEVLISENDLPPHFVPKYNPRQQFRQLYSVSDRRNRRSITETESFLPSIHEEVRDYQFSENKLIIINVDENHEGEYFCVAKLAGHKAISSNSFNLQIAHMANLLTPVQTQVIFKPNETAMLRCQIPESLPAAEIEWFKWDEEERPLAKSGKCLYVELPAVVGNRLDWF